MRILSLDIETTGLDFNSDDILELGLVAYDTSKPFVPTPENTLRIVFLHQRLSGSIFALNLNRQIIAEINSKPKAYPEFHEDGQKTTVYINPEDAESFNSLINWFILANNLGGTLNVAGKNAAGFDIPFLKTKPLFNDFTNRLSHKVLDAGSVYFNPSLDTESLPGLAECCKRAGLKNTTVTHISTDDAIMVVRCLEAKFNS